MCNKVSVTIKCHIMRITLHHNTINKSINSLINFLISAGKTDFSEFCLWKKDRFLEYFHIRALPTIGNKDELVALAFWSLATSLSICLSQPQAGV